ncbi:thioredoxin [Yinghuangia seranimata]|uniref:thioredoxin n=1 Tax=Yinghuangia seranimata TaxID=408067 RepID=UPI00248B6C8F|nr:thioredoxin [Yinghuangia seranimata]MDI2128309.1 thioredoxin [Yinghuangia seranimata]
MTAEQTGLRVQESLDRLTGTGAQAAAEDLVREMMAFYGEGLAAVVRLLPGDALEPLLDDPAVAGLLVLHDLHPEDVAARIARALSALPEQPVDIEEFDPDTGVLRLRRRGGADGGCGCGGGAAVREAVEGVLACHAPEVASVDIAEPPKLLQIGVRPPEPARRGEPVEAAHRGAPLNAAHRAEAVEIAR